MNIVDTSATMPSHADPVEDVQQLQFELNTLRDEVIRNNRQIHEIQIRDMESIESMKYHLERKRNLNERIKKLRSRILKHHVSRQGGVMKMDEWLAGLNIALSPDRQNAQKFVEDDCGFSKSQYYDDDVHGDLLEELSNRLDNLLRVANQSNDSSALVVGETLACCSPKMARSNDVNVQRTNKTDTEIGFSQQQHQQQQQYTNKSVSSSTFPSIKPSSPPLTSTNIARKSGSGFGTQLNPAKRLNYPANVEIRSIQTPPIHPNKRKTVTAFTTNHPLSRKQTKSTKHNKHGGVGDFMVHGRNAASASLTTFNSTGQSQSTNKFSGLVWTVVIIASATALLYMYPSLFNCILLLKDGAEQTRDEVTRILDAIIVRAGGNPWLSRSESESDAESYEPPPPPPSSSSSWTSQTSSQNVGQGEESIWRTIQEYARAAYRYVLYDFP